MVIKQNSGTRIQQYARNSLKKTKRTSKFGGRHEKNQIQNGYLINFRIKSYSFF
jgi:hypothetical protein